MNVQSPLADYPTNRCRSSKPLSLICIMALMLVVLITASLWCRNIPNDESFKNKYAISQMVSDVSKGRAVLDSTFDEGLEGLTGLVIKGNTQTGKKKIAWYHEGAGVIIFGPVVDKNGQDLTNLAAKTHIHDEKNDSGNEIRPQEMGAFIFKKGEGANVRHLYIVVSSSCPTCRNLLQKIHDPSVQFAKDVQVSLIPIAHSKQDRVQGAILLETGSFGGKGQPLIKSMITVSKNTQKLLSQTNSKIRTPMLLHDGQIIKSFSPFIAVSNQDRLTSVQ